MTGFGAAAGEDGRHHLRVEVRSVNHRHLLVKSRLGSDFAFLEGEVERLVRKRLSRGSVTVGLVRRRSPEASAAALDVKAARRYRDELARLAEELGIADAPDLASLIGLPGVLVSSEEVLDPEALASQVTALVDEALARLIEMREQEGRALAADLTKNLGELARILARVGERIPEVVREHRAALVKRIGELVGDQKVSETDLAREVAVLADRLDVSEELSRLESHVELLGSLLEEGGASGRKLDFLVQEIFREVNTIGSKCADARVAHDVVEAKTFVERLREQVQNVE